MCNISLGRGRNAQEIAILAEPSYNGGMGLAGPPRRALRGALDENERDMTKAKLVAALAAAALLPSACVQQPTSPTVAVMPAPYKPFEVFQQDQSACMQYGSQMVAGGASSANTQAVGTAAVGTALGAGLGAAAGGGPGAAIGAAGGAVVGTAVAVA